MMQMEMKYTFLDARNVVAINHKLSARNVLLGYARFAQFNRNKLTSLWLKSKYAVIAIKEI
jgi:hypothetical protein